MAIRRGVSSYSYQNLIFERKMYWNDFIRVIREDLNSDGVEIIDETFINGYPFPTDEFIYAWRNEIARYNMKSVTMDIYLDVLQFRDHVMNHAQAAERLRRDLIIASKLGFENVRCLATVPMNVIEACLDTAEKYNVRIGQEIHAPLQIRFDEKTNRNPPGIVDAQLTEHMIEMIERTGTKHAGFVPDMGLFQTKSTPSNIAMLKRTSPNPDVVDFILEAQKTMSPEEITQRVKEDYPETNLMSVGRLIVPQASAKPEELLDIIPYTVSIHGKFYEMIEDPDNPGHYIEPSIDYAAIFDALKKGGFDGYINSEFEGQSAWNDLPDDQMVDEREQVRRHHAMLRDLGAV